MTETVTELLDRAEFQVNYNDETNTWEIVDGEDEDGYRQLDIPHDRKLDEMKSAAEFIVENIFPNAKLS